MALEVIERLTTTGKSDYVKLQAAQDIMDRAGYKPVEQKQVQMIGDLSVHIDLSGD